MSINHLHLLLRAECETAPGADDEQKIHAKVTQMISDINMKVFMEPKVKYMPDIGNEGLTFVAGLETSHTAAHFWDKPDTKLMKTDNSTLLQMDAYTCGPLDENQIKVILHFISEYKPKQLSVAVYDRSRHDTFFEPIYKISYSKKSKGNYLKFVNDLKIDFTKKYKKKFISAA